MDTGGTSPGHGRAWGTGGGEAGLAAPQVQISVK